LKPYFNIILRIPNGLLLSDLSPFITFLVRHILLNLMILLANVVARQDAVTQSQTFESHDVREVKL
jgi:hypothetical protein